MRKLVVVLALSFAVPAPAGAPFDYMAALRKTEADLATALRSGDVDARRFALQMLATQQSMVGDTERAIESFHTAMRRGSSTPLADARGDTAEFLAAHEVRDALTAIVEEARGRQIVMINEAHHVPRDRAFATRVALELRKLGFEYLAMETLGDDAAAIARRGYPTTDERDGYYSREPVLGDFIRRAVRAGYTLVNYEHRAPEEVTDPEQRIAAREQGQAQNIIDRILAKDPRARVLVYVGHGHLTKGPYDWGGKNVPMMAERLRARTGIDPLCIDQAREDPVGPAMDAILERTRFASFVLRKRGAGHPYSGIAAVDMFVYHRPVQLVHGRPHWLAMDGYRRPRKIPAKLLPAEERRLVQAFFANEGADAVPVDQVLVTAGEEPPVLMLPRGRFRYATQD